MGTILGNTQAFYLGLVGLLFLGERFGWRYTVAVPLAFTGITLLVGIEAHPGPSSDWVRGVAYGLATGIVYAGFLLVLRRLRSTRWSVSTTCLR